MEEANALFAVVLLRPQPTPPHQGSQPPFTLSYSYLSLQRKYSYKYRGCILGCTVIGTIILRILLPAIHSHLHQQIIPPPFGFLGLEISTATAESCFPLNVALFFILLHFFLHVNTSFPNRNNNKKCIKRRKTLTENHTTPHSFKNL